MSKTKPLFKKMWMLLAFLFCSVVSANAATITYSLTTHVDGRTMTATAEVAAGADLLSSMPQALWRAYCTYTFRNEAGEVITTAPDNGGTVFVDYEFDPPFIVSEDGQDPVWHYLKHEPGVGQKYYYYSEYHGKLDQKYGNELPFEQTENLRTGSQTLKTRENAQWAFYGDAYCLNLKFNDVNNIESNDFMVCQITSRTLFGRTTYTYKVKTGAKMMPGWQLYVNDALNGSFSLGLPEDIHINRLLWLYDLGDSGQVKDLSTERDAGRSSKNHITNTDSQGQGWDECLCYAFMATPASDPPGSLNPWRVTYKIQKADGTWYADIIEQKTADNLTPTWPVQGFTPAEGCEYDYFYKDATFTEKFVGAMPNDCNTTLYIMETEINYISQPWKTLVLPFAIDDLAEYFGADYEGVPSVNVSELQDVQGTLTEVGDQSFYHCKLIFNPVRTIEAYKPYLFKVNRVNERIINEMYAAEGKDPCEVTEVADPVNAGISACMQGTLEGYDMDASDGLSFYFGYDEANDAYNFYRVSARIPKNRCWFYISDNRAAGAKLQVVFDSEVNSINTQIADKSAKGNIYNVNGQLMGTQKSNLPKGLYIVNGKKMVIK